MNITIKIECETVAEFHSHLKELARQVRKLSDKKKLIPIRDEFKPADSDSLNDDNCYGTRTVKIRK